MKKKLPYRCMAGISLKENNIRQCRMPYGDSDYISRETCINDLCLPVIKFVCCVVKSVWYLSFQIVNKRNYTSSFIPVVFIKKKPTDYCGLNISAIYISIVTVAVSILAYGNIDNSDGNHKKNTSTENGSTGKNIMSICKNAPELLCMAHYVFYSTINYSM